MNPVTEFVAGERVWWHTTESATRYGTIREEADRPGVQPDGEQDLLYLDPAQLNRIIPEDDGIYSGISDIEYHADKHSLSSSGARKLLRSPSKFHWAQSQPPETAKHFDIGHFVHGEVLGVGQPVVIIDADSYKTKAAQTERDAAYAAGNIPMLKGDADEARKMVAAVLAHPGAAKLLEDGTAELSAYWHDLDTRARLRARFDKLREFPDGRPPLLIDLKTTTSADPDDFGATAGKFGLHFQAAWYREAIRAIGVHDDASFVFINVEKEPPYEVSLTRLPETAMELGARQMRRAIDLYAECRATDTWPGYGNEIHTRDIPRWVYNQEAYHA